MPRIDNEIDIAAPSGDVFAIINDIEKWPEIFNEYSKARVLDERREGRFLELTFELSNNEGASWRSWRLVDHEKLVAVAERVDPLFPFRYMHLKWTCESTSDGTRMRWTQDFELDDEFETPLDTVVDRMVAHTKENQKSIKEQIESGSVTTR